MTLRPRARCELRHLGAGRGAEFVGGTAGNIAMDRAQVRTAYYTPKEAADQLEIIAKEHGAEGEKLLRGADAYLAGINAAQDKMCPLGQPIGPDCPVEYAALKKRPTLWTRADLTYIASLVGGIFGKVLRASLLKAARPGRGRSRCRQPGAADV